MINSETFVQDLETALKPFEGIKFSNIADICLLRSKLNSTLSGFAKRYPKVQVSGKLEIKNKTTLSYIVSVITATDVFYPGWVCKFRYVKDFDVFTRGKRNNSIKYNLQEKDWKDAIICAIHYLLGAESNDALHQQFQRVRSIQGRVVMTPRQREFVNNVRKLTWNKIPLAYTRNTIIQLSQSFLPQITPKIPLDTKAVAASVNQEVSTPPKAEKVIKEKHTDVILENTCYYCKKWMSSRNTGDSGISFASCPIRGRKTLSSDYCGKFKHV